VLLKIQSNLDLLKASLAQLSVLAASNNVSRQPSLHCSCQRFAAQGITEMENTRTHGSVFGSADAEQSGALSQHDTMPITAPSALNLRTLRVLHEHVRAVERETNQLLFLGAIVVAADDDGTRCSSYTNDVPGCFSHSSSPFRYKSTYESNTCYARADMTL
jgi:hypothetical protein